MPTLFQLSDDKVLAYAEYGPSDGYPLLTQHGLIASIEDGDLFQPLTRAGVRVISVARPGYGDSTPVVLRSYAHWAGMVSHLASGLKIPHFDVLGMSSGAPYAYALGACLPKMARNIFIFSGLPALYDEQALSFWPNPPLRNLSVEDLEPKAKEWFFGWVTEADLQKNDIRDSMRNNCFGVAQDLRLRFMDWGFSLADVNSPVFMRHSRTDDVVPFQAAVRTAELLPHCRLELLDSGPHFSEEALADFMKSIILPTSPGESIR